MAHNVFFANIEGKGWQSYTNRSFSSPIHRLAWYCIECAIYWDRKWSEIFNWLDGIIYSLLNLKKLYLSRLVQRRDRLFCVTMNSPPIIPRKIPRRDKAQGVRSRSRVALQWPVLNCFSSTILLRRPPLTAFVDKQCLGTLARFLYAQCVPLLLFDFTTTTSVCMAHGIAGANQFWFPRPPFVLCNDEYWVTRG